MTVPARFEVFVYGTLKRGQRNHERFCRGALEVREVTACGRLYSLPFGFPGLVVPEENTLAVGTVDYLADARATGRTAERPPGARHGWDEIHGELLTFDDPEERLPALDALEGYRPGEHRFYKRVLIPVAPLEAEPTVLAWTYAAESASGVYLPGGRWPAGCDG